MILKKSSLLRSNSKFLFLAPFKYSKNSLEWVIFPGEVKRLSVLKHPQDLVPPEVRWDLATFTVCPQSHLHKKVEDLNLLMPAKAMMVRRANLSPIWMLFLYISTCYRYNS